MEMLVKPIIEKDSKHGRRDGSQADIAPFKPDHLLLFAGLVLAEWTEVGEEIEDDGEDGCQLDDDKEEFEEVRALGILKGKEFLQDNHVSGGGDWKPFGDAFDDTEDDGFDEI